MSNESSIERGNAIRKRIKQVIVEYIQQHGYPPTVREIGNAVALKSTSSVYNHLRKMLDDGDLETDAGFSSPRAIRVPGYTFQEGKFVKLEGYLHTGRQLYVKEEAK